MATDPADPRAGDGNVPGLPSGLPSSVSSSTGTGVNDTGATRSGFRGARLARLVRRQARANARKRPADGSP